MKKKEKPKYGVWSNVCFMVKHAWREHKSVIFLCVASSLMMIGIHLTELFIVPVILQQIQDKVSIGKLLLSIAAFTASLMLLRGLISYGKVNGFVGRLAVRTEILQCVHDKAANTSYPNLKDPRVNALMECALSEEECDYFPEEKIWETLENLLTHSLCFALYVVLLPNLPSVLLITVIITSALSFIAEQYMQRWNYSHKTELFQSLHKINYIKEKSQDTSIGKEIRIFGVDKWLNQIYAAALKSYELLCIKKQRVQAVVALLDTVLEFLRNGIAYLFLIGSVVKGEMNAPEFLLYFSAFSGFSEWIIGIMKDCIELNEESMGLSKVQEYLNLREQFCFEGGNPIPVSEAYTLTLEDVTFQYPGAPFPTLKKINLTIHAGEKLAVVGLNGAGKTTLVKLLCGFYDPTEGRVLLNGTDIRTFNRNEYYQLFSAVFQDYSILDMTLGENVTQTSRPYDQDRVTQCLDKAGLLDYVRTLPKGCDTPMGKCVFLDRIQLSGGQIQRLLLARALYKDGPVMILDEPTAALDPIAESDIYEKYNSISRGKTSVFISHRLASTRFCDRIVFLEQGKIAEEGTHTDLLIKNGGYAKLFNIQARYYQEGGAAKHEECTN